jgi:hypothetical protein
MEVFALAGHERLGGIFHEFEARAGTDDSDKLDATVPFDRPMYSVPTGRAFDDRSHQKGPRAKTPTWRAAPPHVGEKRPQSSLSLRIRRSLRAVNRHGSNVGQSSVSRSNLVANSLSAHNAHKVRRHGPAHGILYVEIPGLP